MRPKKIIVLVDGDQYRLDARMFQLQTWGYRVVPYSNGFDALAALRETEAALLMAHMTVPGLDGATLTALAQGEHPELSTLVLSFRQADTFLLAGGTRYHFDKPENAAILRDTIRTLVARKPGRRRPTPRPQQAAA